MSTFRQRYVGSSLLSLLAAPGPRNLTSVAASAAVTKIPHARGLKLGNGTNLYDGISHPERYQVRFTDIRRDTVPEELSSRRLAGLTPVSLWKYAAPDLVGRPAVDGAVEFGAIRSIYCVSA